jgi:hypothetical protein
LNSIATTAQPTGHLTQEKQEFSLCNVIADVEGNERKPQHPEEGRCAAALNMQPEEEAGLGQQDSVNDN